LFARLPVFASLRQMRRRLMDPAQFAQAAAELGSAAPAPAAAAQPAADNGSLLAGLLGGRPAGLAPAHGSSALPGGRRCRGCRRLHPQSHRPAHPADHRQQQASLVASVDAATAAEMRAVLHAPVFQTLESAWRGVQWLISSLELDETLELHLFDAARDELAADIVASQGRLAETGLHRALADRWRNLPGGQGWTVIAGLQHFGPGDADIGLMAALGLIARQSGGPWLASADTALALAEPAALAGWAALRRSEAAPWLGLAAPRVLLRLPYGRRSDPCSAFAFEEFAGGSPDHEALLWGPARSRWRSCSAGPTHRRAGSSSPAMNARSATCRPTTTPRTASPRCRPAPRPTWASRPGRPCWPPA
jgi:type VI secretion system protein ImpC